MLDNILDLRPFQTSYPHFIAFLSFHIRKLNPQEKIKIFYHPLQKEKLWKWSQETGNKILWKNNNYAEVIRGKGHHGICLTEKISFYAWGIKLHLREFLINILDKYPQFLINFVSLKEGLRSINQLKALIKDSEGLVLPSPREIEGYCGFAVGFYSLPTAKKFFFTAIEKGYGVETLFKGKTFEIILKSWEVNSNEIKNF
jgi:hypothetical protein